MTDRPPAHRAPRIAIIQFPGSNCDQDCVWAAKVAGADSYLVFHTETDLGDPDAIVLPGGFAHGDYLRTGALAKFSPAMRTVTAMADKGTPVIGICNGFQILCEAGLLTGALIRNAGLRFLCMPVSIEVVDNQTPLTASFEIGERLTMPINHYEGNFVAAKGNTPRTVLRYVDNPNGSWDSTAGIANERGNVVGLMPHPDRACEPFLGSTDGARMFESLVAHAERVSA